MNGPLHTLHAVRSIANLDFVVAQAVDEDTGLHVGGEDAFKQREFHFNLSGEGCYRFIADVTKSPLTTTLLTATTAVCGYALSWRSCDGSRRHVTQVCIRLREPHAGRCDWCALCHWGPH